MSAIRADRDRLLRRPARGRAGRGAALCLALLACALAAGCERNSATPFLVPTGIRPSLTHPPGGVFGALHYAPAQRPDLASPPFPPTRVELLRGRDSSLVTQDSLPTTERTFSFTGIQPGVYLVRALARGFEAPLVSVTVVDRPRDAGDLTLPIDGSVYSALVGLIGTMPGYDYDSYYSNLFNSPVIGIFTYPSDFHAEATVQVPAGTHRFMFVTDPSFTDDLIGWGGDASELLTVPLVDHRATFGHGPAHNLNVSFPVTGAYVFSLDEARQTFSITLATAALRSHDPLTSRRSR